MDHRARVLSRGNGSLRAVVMFVGEAPGRLGADTSGIPFHGDTAGRNFEGLLEFSGLSRANTFVTNAVLCNPRDESGNNSPPTMTEVANCASFLREQVDLVDPKIVVALGAVALSALGLIQAHGKTLRSNVRTATAWYGRTLVPLYHPGQRAMIHRSLANQRSDYQFVAELASRRGLRPSASLKPSGAGVSAVARELMRARGRMTYFALHKLYYLAEYEFAKRYGRRLSGAYFVRQKDGPYCVDLQLGKLKQALPELQIDRTGHLQIDDRASDLFGPPANDPPREARETIQAVIARWGDLSNARLKMAVYLTRPMRHLLRRELREGLNLYNAAIDFLVDG